MKKTYLGDSVYIDFDGWNLVLTTENGAAGDPSNVICVEPQVWEAMKNYVEQLIAHNKEEVSREHVAE